MQVVRRRVVDDVDVGIGEQRLVAAVRLAARPSASAFRRADASLLAGDRDDVDEAEPADRVDVMRRRRSRGRPGPCRFASSISPPAVCHASARRPRRYEEHDVTPMVFVIFGGFVIVVAEPSLTPDYFSSNPGRGSRPRNSFAASMLVMRMFAAS